MLLKKFIPFPQISFLLCVFAAPTTAQIVPDNTLPRNSTVNVQGNVIEINDGTRTGNNLFHSFERFSVPTDNTAFFNNAADIQNIFSRVTGTSISEINGMIRANGFANLFLLNPNGIIFGENASLDIGGSFFATSADRIVFTNGSEFSSTNPNTPPLLTINIPLGLGFRDNPGRVVNRSFASVVEVDETGEEFERFVGLQVPLEQTLALVGGEVSLEGGILTAESGRVELGSVAGNNFITLQPVAERVELIGTTADGQAASSLNAQVVLGATGDGGTLTVETPQLTILGGAQIASGTAGSEGQGATVIINADSILVSGASPLGDVRSSSGIFVTAEPVVRDEEGEPIRDEFGNQIITGADAGQLTINATELIVEDGAKVSAENFGTGLGGNATLNIDRLIVRSGGLVSAGSLIEPGVESNERGPGGTLTINAAESVEVTGTGLLGDTPVRSRLVAESQGTGDAGDLNISTPNLRVTDNAEVTVSAIGDGEAGNLIINASDIRLENGRFSAETRLGTEGNIEIDASDIRLRRGSAITTNSLNTGTGGNIQINTNLLTAIENSDISANALAGPGGQVRISADSIFATQFRPQQSNASDITATSELGPEFSGDVELDSEIDPAQGLVELPQTVVDPAALIAQDPCKLGQNSEFIITGRGGLARTPNDRFDGNNVQVNLVDPVTTPRRSASVRRNTSTTATPPRSSLDIIPARGWIRNENGDVILVSYDPTQTGVRRQPTPSTQCQR